MWDPNPTMANFPILLNWCMGNIRAYKRFLLYRNMAADSRAVHQRHLVTDYRVVSHMRVCHEKDLIADNCLVAFARGPVDCHKLAEDAAVPYFKKRNLAFELQILTLETYNTTGEKLVVLADRGISFYDNMGMQLCSLSERNMLPYNAVGPYFHI